MKIIRHSIWLTALAGISCTNAIITSSYGQYPDKCPIQCAGVMANPLNWTRFHRLEDLSRCDDGILFSFNVQNLLTDPDTQVSVQACSYTGNTSDRSGSSPPQRRDDPVDQADFEHTLSIKTKRGASIAQRPSSPRAGSAASGTVDISNDVHHAAEMLATYLQNGAECGTTIMFAQSENAIVGLYSGAQVQKKSAAELVRTFQEHTPSGNRALELCTGNNIGTETFGMFAGQISDLNAIQEAVRTWTNAGCLGDKDLTPLDEVTVGFLVSSDSSDSSAMARSLDLEHSPQQDSNGNCYTYTVQPDDGCWAIGNSFGIAESDIESYNKKTWGWAGCGHMQFGQVICVSAGDAPFPPAIEGATCGPQVPGTVKPTGSTDWAGLNPCPLNACCDVWGSCGITEEFCTATPADTGAPGTAQPHTNGCISNCGTDIVNNEPHPDVFRTIGYFEAFNKERPCLTMDVTDMDTSKLTHIHFAFATVTKDFDVSVEAVKDQFAKYKSMKTSAKKILSFGGWTFSTGENTFQLFRDATNADHRATFAANLVAFMNDNNLDGLDFDWEYPGAPDIPGVPPGSPAEASNYLEFLVTLKQIMPSGKSISVALPASFWYLQQYPVAWMQYFVDYFIYMTYDLHGQWDVGNDNVSPGCEGGNCLRSHVNKTETISALSMITKAGVSASKVAIGITSYGRSFRMFDSSCTGPLCTYTGTRNHSNAFEGRCTKTAGYISNAELQEIIDGKSNYSLMKSSYDSASDSNILVYGTQDKADWVAYMDAATKNSRIGWARYAGFGGTTDWAVDLMEFVDSNGGDDGGDSTSKCSADDRTYSTEKVDPGSYYRWALLDPENAAASQKQYITIVNLTPHRFKLTSTHSYQMTTFDWADIPPGRARQNVVVYDGSDTPVDDNGEAYYSIEGTDKTFFVRTTTHIPDNYPSRTVFDLSGMGLGQREYKDPDAESPVTLVITGSDSYGFITSLIFGPGNWMKKIYNVIKDRPIKHVIIPGTHDSGMSTISGHLLSGGSALNTQTQALNIYDQLRAGARWFDLRIASIHQTTPNEGDYGFWVTHVNDELAEVVIGNTGEGLEDVLSEINQFTKENPGEIIFFRVRYLVGLRKVPSKGPIYWTQDIANDFFTRLKTVNNRCGDLDTGFHNQKASYFMDRNDGAGCVIFLLDGHLDDAMTSNAPADGIYPASYMKFFDNWSEKEDTEALAEDQVADWNTNNRSLTSTTESFWISQWQVTPQLTISTLYGLEALAVIPTNPTMYWKGVDNMHPENWPNVLMVDYIGVLVPNEHDWNQLGADIVTLAIGLNLYMVSENCDFSKGRSPLLTSASSRMALLSASVPWNGIIFANGTKIDYPPTDLHVGRVEVLKNGTIFGNGTVLTSDVPNPDFNSTS